ncbi:helicase [Halobacteriales archaeon QS_1_68_17]|nr:MAG: helicase [Halobacteriales archaeon QS_1_68_17]
MTGDAPTGTDVGSRPLTADELERTLPGYEGQVVDRIEQPAKPGLTVDPATVLPDLDVPFDGLYEHQAEAIAALQDGANVAVSTATASGKTYIYGLYFAWLQRRRPGATALFTYPTKALSGDQVTELNDLYDDLGLDVLVEKYDGDTPADRKRAIRDRADVVVTNFAGLNVYLPHHHRWRSTFADCELVVVDEAHAYTGVQGMHVAWILRRLLRVLDRYGSDPQLVCSSATVGNPVEHAERLTGRPFALVDEDTSPRGAREIVFWDPPAGDGGSGGDDPLAAAEAGRSANAEAADLLAHLGLSGVRTLTFVRSRQGAEVTAKQAERAAGRHPTDGYLSVRPYHAGHGKETRRGTEHGLKSGTLDGVVTTNALELGIDVGSVDAAVLAGYPGSRQSFWQQLGRAGRGTDDALGVLVARSDAIDQYVLDDPGYLLEDDVEDAVLDLSNNVVYAQHVLCGANEMPLTDDDREWFDVNGAHRPADDGNEEWSSDRSGDPQSVQDRPAQGRLPSDGRGNPPDEGRLDAAVGMWKDAGKLVGDLDRGVQYAGPPRPEADVDMYATTGERFEVRLRGDGEIDIADLARGRAYRDFHPGALVLHDGVQYEAVALREDTPNPYVELQRVSTNEYTRTQHTKEVTDLDRREVVDLGGGYRLGWGMGTVNVHYDAYTRHEIGSGDLVGGPRPLEVPPVDLRTGVTWVRTPPELGERVLDGIPGEDLLAADAPLGEREYTFLGGLHGAEHAMIKLAPLELHLSKSDLGGLSTLSHPATGGPTWFVHDAVDGGVGFARSIFGHASAVARRTRERVAACDCGVQGCPSCLMDHQCGNRNEPLHAPATVGILDAVLDRLDDG